VIIWLICSISINSSELFSDDSALYSAGRGNEVGVDAVVERIVEEPNAYMKREVPQSAPGTAKGRNIFELKTYFSNFNL
jgi:hypothetical protein